MFTTIFRIIKYALQNFFRNGWLTMATLAVMILALLVFEALLVFNALTNIGLNLLKDKIDVSVYFKDTAEEKDILQIRDAVADIKEVKKVEYISKAKALLTFKEKHRDDPIIQASLEELSGNPLSASLNIKAGDPKDYPTIVTYFNRTELQPLIEKVTYHQNQLVIDRLVKIVDTTQKVGFALTFYLAVTAVLVTLNAISLAIYSNRDEIGIMRLVGAPNVFIRGPYVVEGIVYGAIAAVLSIILALPFIYFASSYVNIFLEKQGLENYFYDNIWWLLGYQLLFGIILGAVSSMLAVNRYLKK